MRIAIVTPWFPTEGRPQDGAFIRDHVAVARRLGEVRILHVPETGVHLDGPPLDPGATTIEAPTHLPGPMAHLAQALRAAAVLRRWRPDVVHAHTFEAAACSLLGRGGARLVLTEHHSSVLLGALTSRQRTKAAVGYARVDGLTAVSRALADRIAQDFPPAEPGVLPNPVDVDALTAFAHLDDRTGIAFVGRLEHVKGLDVLLRAMSLLARDGRDHRLSVVGDGQQATELRRLARELGVDHLVEWLGAQPHQRAIKILARASCLAVPSRTETFGVVAVEALALGTPVVATAVGALPDLLGPARLPLVPPEDPASLATALDQLLGADLPDPAALVRAVAPFAYDAVEARLRELYFPSET